MKLPEVKQTGMEAFWLDVELDAWDRLNLHSGVLVAGVAQDSMAGVPWACEIQWPYDAVVAAFSEGKPLDRTPYEAALILLRQTTNDPQAGYYVAPLKHTFPVWQMPTGESDVEQEHYLTTTLYTRLVKYVRPAVKEGYAVLGEPPRG